MVVYVDGFEGLQSYVDGLENNYNSTNFDNLLRAWIVDLAELHQLRFDSETDPEGIPWEPLADSTAELKGHDRILYDKADLMGSLVVTTDDTIREVYNEGHWQALAFGTSDFKSILHQEGTRNMPARVHVGVTEKEIDVMTEQAADFAVAVLFEGNPL